MVSSKSNDSIERSNPSEPSWPLLDLMAGQSVLLSSFALKGDLIADETTRVEGRVKGDVLVQNHQLRIGRTGRVLGNVFGKSIIVEGRVNGNLCAKESLTLRPTAEVQGNLVATQVKLEDGCRFRGTIEMDDKARKSAISTARKRASTTLSGEDHHLD